MAIFIPFIVTPIVLVASGYTLNGLYHQSKCLSLGDFQHGDQNEKQSEASGAVGAMAGLGAGACAALVWPKVPQSTQSMFSIQGRNGAEIWRSVSPRVARAAAALATVSVVAGFVNGYRERKQVNR
jgi:hypothetical protein